MINTGRGGVKGDLEAKSKRRRAESTACTCFDIAFEREQAMIGLLGRTLDVPHTTRGNEQASLTDVLACWCSAFCLQDQTVQRLGIY